MNLGCLGCWAVFHAAYVRNAIMCYIAKPRTIVSPLTPNVPKCSYPFLVDWAGQEQRPRKKKSVKGRHWHIWQPVSKWSNSGTPNTPTAIKSGLNLQEKSAKYLYISPWCSLWDIVWKGNQLCPEPLGTQRGSNCRPVLHTSLSASPLSRSPLITRSIQCWCARTHLLDTRVLSLKYGERCNSHVAVSSPWNSWSGWR